MEKWKVFEDHQVFINDMPPSSWSDHGKWSWLREAVNNTPLESWMSVRMPNRQEALRAQSSINNKYIKDPLRRHGKLIRTRVTADDPRNPSGIWKIHWYIWHM